MNAGGNTRADALFVLVVRMKGFFVVLFTLPRSHTNNEISDQSIAGTSNGPLCSQRASACWKARMHITAKKTPKPREEMRPLLLEGFKVKLSRFALVIGPLQR
jgi:hypothetical protein